jgi:hypothetical protein
MSAEVIKLPGADDRVARARLEEAFMGLSRVALLISQRLQMEGECECWVDSSEEPEGVPVYCPMCDLVREAEDVLGALGLGSACFYGPKVKWPTWPDDEAPQALGSPPVGATTGGATGATEHEP